MDNYRETAELSAGYDILMWDILAIKADKFIYPRNFVYILQYPGKVVRLSLVNWEELPDTAQRVVIAEKLARYKI